MNAEAEEFRRLAQDYCSLVERPGDYDRVDFMGELLRLISTLYVAAGRLPNVEPDTEELLPDRPTSDEWSAVLQGLGDPLGKLDYYRDLLVTVDGVGEVDQVTDRVLAALRDRT